MEFEEGILATRSKPKWRVFGLGGQWEGEARDEYEALEKAKLAGVVVVSWVRKVED